jgi:adenylosuccinate synthase
MLHNALFDHKTILLEGAQGALLDSDFSTYRFVTSPSTVAVNAAAGAGLPPRSVDRVVGVYKAYLTRIGSGPMPTGLFNATGMEMRDRGDEFSTTTGQERRCGWFDAVAARFVAQRNGLDAAIITKLDVLDTFPTIKICTAYNLHGKIIYSLPATLSDLAACEPIYEELEGWQSSTNNITSYDELPTAAKAFIKRLEELLETPIAMISVSPRRGRTIQIQDILTMPQRDLDPVQKRNQPIR